MISIVTPVYNEDGNVVYFHDEVTKVMQTLDMDYEIIYVNDGSKDRTDELIHQLATGDPHVRALTFARNFGHQIAITCGMDFAVGDAVITMDGDMRHPPALIPKLIQKWQEGYDIVQTIRTATEDAGPIKKLTSAGYYAVINSISNSPVVPGGSDFRLMDRKALDAFLRFREHSRFIRGIVGGLGFKQCTVEFEAPARHAGVSKFSMKNAALRDGRHHHKFHPAGACGILSGCLRGRRRHPSHPSCPLLRHDGQSRPRLGDHDHPHRHLRQLESHGPRHHRRIPRTYV